MDGVIAQMVRCKVHQELPPPNRSRARACSEPVGFRSSCRTASHRSSCVALVHMTVD